MRFLPLALVLAATAPVWGAPRSASTPAPSFEQKFPKSLAQMGRVQNPDVRALLKAAIKRSGALSIEFGPFSFFLLSHDSKTLLINSYEPTTAVAHVFRLQHGRVKEIVRFSPSTDNSGRLLPDNNPFAESAAFSPDGRWLATESTNSRRPTIALWNARTWKLIRVFPVQSNTVSSVAFSRDGRRLAGGNMGGGVTVYDVASGKILSQWHAPTIFKRVFVAFARTAGGAEKLVAITANRDYEGYSADVTQTQEEAGHAEPSQLWQTQTNQLVAEFPEAGDVRLVAFNSDATRVALAAYNVNARQEGRVAGQLFVADLATTSHQLFAWDVPGYPSSLLWTPDDQNILSVGMGQGSNWLRTINAPILTLATP